MNTPTRSGLADVLAQLQAHARPGELAGMARFGIRPERRLGVAIPTLRSIAKALGRNHALALQLWATGIPDAQILASLLAEPERLTETQMDAWVDSFCSWDVCDQTCLNALRRSPLAWSRLTVWAARPEEFVRRAAFSLLAALAVHDRRAPDERFTRALALIEAASSDERNYVKKAVNWALRTIGKRNPALNAAAIASAQRIQAQGSRPARWIAADALRELGSEAVQARLHRPPRPQRDR